MRAFFSALGLPRASFHDERVQPLLGIAAGTDVGRDPGLADAQVGHLGDDACESLFREVGEVAAVALALEGAVLEGDVERARGAQGVGQAGEDGGEVVLLHV